MFGRYIVVGPIGKLLYMPGCNYSTRKLNFEEKHSMARSRALALNKLLACFKTASHRCQGTAFATVKSLPGLKSVW